jgi:hypothetical protein
MDATPKPPVPAGIDDVPTLSHVAVPPVTLNFATLHVKAAKETRPVRLNWPLIRSTNFTFIDPVVFVVITDAEDTLPGA